MQAYGAKCWLINTGWTGGPFGIGKRISIHHTRALLNAALEGELEKTNFRTDKIFGFQVPVNAPGVPSEILNPKNTWAKPSDYDAQAKKLAILFNENFKQFEDRTPKSVIIAGPKIE